MKTLSETDLILSLCKQPAFLEQIVEELAPDDTLELLNGTRKAKSDVQNLEHIVGASDMNARIKAKEARLKSVTQTKSKQLQRMLLAIGVYLRKVVTQNLQSAEELSIVLPGLGRLSLGVDPAAPYDSLSVKKIKFEPDARITPGGA